MIKFSTFVPITIYNIFAQVMRPELIYKWDFSGHGYTYYSTNNK